MTTTPNNQDDEIDSILVKLYTSGMHEKQKEFDTYQNMTRKEKKDFRAYIHTPFLAMTQDAKAAILAWHNQQLERAVIEATKPPLDLNAYENQLSSQVSDIDAFNLFIKKWCPSASHLLDSDDNDGQYMRDRLTQLTESKEGK